jgi:ubiquitin-conjugating enzyme E2 Z
MSLPKRLPKEIADAQALRASGIYYEADEMNGRRGYAMIIGPEGTPYAFCPLFFTFQLPADYPFSSPAVTFVTTDGATRFHPNLYVGGKVCLSILGTWSGPSWAAVMTISTVLSSIQSLLEPNPIVNEPGWEKFTLENERAKNYAEYIQHALVSHSLRSLVRFKKGDVPPEMVAFQDILADKSQEMVKGLTKIIESKAEAEEVTYNSVVYNMHGTTHWKILKKLAETYWTQ